MKEIILILIEFIRLIIGTMVGLFILFAFALITVLLLLIKRIK